MNMTRTSVMTRTSELLILVLVAALAACGGKKAKAEQERMQAQGDRLREIFAADQAMADCKKMCEKSHIKCMIDVLMATGKMDQAKIDEISKAGSLKPAQDAGYAACMLECKRVKGLGPNAVEIKKCLKIKACKTYARCIKKQTQ